MRVDIEAVILKPRHVFRISRGAKTEVRNVILQLHAGGLTGWGEASPNAFYHESAEDVLRRIRGASRWLSGVRVRNAEELRALWPEIWKQVGPSRAAACAIDVALWHWVAQMHGQTIGELLWGEKERPVTSCTTLGLSEPDEVEAKWQEVEGFPLLKIKVGNRGVHLIRQARERTDARLFVDANGSWDADTLTRNAPVFAALGVEAIEQPLPVSTTEMPEPADGWPVILADESCVTPADLPGLPAWYGGFNIKLVKCGGITPALEMIRLGRERGLRIMTGCMLESSILIAAGLAIAQKTDYADLDGSWLLADEPFGRVQFEKGILSLTRII